MMGDDKITIIVRVRKSLVGAKSKPLKVLVQN